MACKGALWACAVLLSMLASVTAAQTAEDYLQHRWYQLEVVLFEQVDENDTGAAPVKVIEALRYPRLAMPLAERPPPADASLPVGARLPVDDAVPLVISNLAPPIWYAGECAAASWRPTPDVPHDPCLARRDVDLEAMFPDDPFAHRVYEGPPDEEEEDEAPDPRQLALDALNAALEDYERTLTETSYVWRRRTPTLAPTLRRLRRGRTVIAAGGWHQALPPRDATATLGGAGGRGGCTAALPFGRLVQRYCWPLRPLSGLPALSPRRWQHGRLQRKPAHAQQRSALLGPSGIGHPGLGAPSRNTERTQPPDRRVSACLRRVTQAAGSSGGKD